MWVEHLGLTDFRSYANVDVELAKGITTFLGRNGQGKTNLIEAVGYLATLSSHRVATDAPLVRVGAEQAVIRARIVNDDRPTTVEVEINPGRANRARINRGPVPRARDILGTVRTVLFAPEDLALVKGDPSDRRRFIDDLLVQRTPRFAGVRADYDRVLKQRNALLKSAGIARRSNPEGMLRTLEVWDEQLVDTGAQIIAARNALLADLTEHAVHEYELVAGSASARLSLRYVSSIGVAGDDRAAWSELLRAGIEARRTDELDRGITLVGPQRDDIAIELGPVPAKGYASHGESWSIALAMQLAAFDLLVADGIDPILILDDVFAELDSQRRDRLAEQVQQATQVLITAAVAEDIPAALAGARFTVDNGQVSTA